MDKKLIDYEGFEAYAKGVKDKYATKNELPTKLVDLQEDTMHRLITDKDKEILQKSVKGISIGVKAGEPDLFFNVGKNDLTASSTKIPLAENNRHGLMSKEDKKKVDAIPANPKYTDTIPDLTPYAKKENIPTKVSQLENNKKYIEADKFLESLKDTEDLFNFANTSKYPLLDFLQNPAMIVGDWNETPFTNGVKMYHSKNAKNSPNGDGAYIVFTSFGVEGNDDDVFNEFNSTEFAPYIVAYHLETGRVFKRLAFARNYNLRAIDSGQLLYTNGISPGAWFEWVEITKDFATKEDVKKLMSDIPTLKKEVVTSLPQTGKDDVIYLVKDEKGKDNNNYLEYLWLNGKYELIGSTQVDLSEYVRKDGNKVLSDCNFSPREKHKLHLLPTKDELGVELGKKANRTELRTKLSEMIDDSTHRLVTDTEKETWNNKLDKTKDKAVVDSNTDYSNNTLYTTPYFVQQAIGIQISEHLESFQQSLEEELKKTLKSTDIQEFTQQELEEAFK